MSSLRLVLITALLAGCTAEPPRPAGRRGLPIVNGTTDMGDPEVPIVVFEFNEGGVWYGSICTGTLIGPRTVITAAHCADTSTRNHQVYFGYNPYGASDPTFLGLFDVTVKQHHPSWNPSDLGAGNDVALLLLDAEPPVTPKPINRMGITSSHLGDAIRIVGFGITGPGDMTNPIKRQANTTLDDFNFNLIVDGTGTSNTCQGDSGGPHFMNFGAGEVLVGVTSFGDPDCAMYAGSGRVDFFARRSSTRSSTCTTRSAAAPTAAARPAAARRIPTAPAPPTDTARPPARTATPIPTARPAAAPRGTA